MGGECLHARVRRLPFARRPRCRPPGSAQGLHRGAGAVLDRIEALCPDATVYATRPPKAAGALVDIVAGDGKGLAVRDLAASLGVAPEAVGAIGDGANDVSLLEPAAHRYAIAQSELAAVFTSAVPVSGRSAVAEALSSFARDLCG